MSFAALFFSSIAGAARNQRGGTVDSTAATLTSATATVTGSHRATVGITPGETGGRLVGVRTASSTKPTQDQVLAGLDHTGAAAQYVIDTTSHVTGANTWDFTDLSENTGHYMHWCHIDAAGNKATVVSSSLFTTWTSLATEYLSGSDEDINAGPTGGAYTFTNKAVGSADTHSRKRVTLLFGTNGGANHTHPTSVVINGVTFTRRAHVNAGANALSLYRGTTNVTSLTAPAFTVGGTPARAFLRVFTDGREDPPSWSEVIETYLATVLAGESLNDTMDIPAKGAVIAGATFTTNTTQAWTGATEVLEELSASTFRVGAAIYETTGAAEIGRNIAIAPTADCNNMRLVAIPLGEDL